jgi:iron(III) transport system permease protein
LGFVGWLAFALLPSWSLDYGLLESTSDEMSRPTAGHS